MRLVIFGLSITSSWGNGHATTFRGLVRALAGRGHDVLFLERDVPWYAENRDLPLPPYCRLGLYADLDALRDGFTDDVRAADAVVVGSYVPDGAAVAGWALDTATGPVAFYDIDTPVTLAALARGDCAYLTPDLIARFALYLSFSGGPALDVLTQKYGSPAARPFYCAVDPDLYFPEVTENVWDLYFPETVENVWDLGYMGTYSDDRQPPLERLMLDAAREWSAGRFCVAGPQYPPGITWPDNVARREHLPPADHRAFYNAQRFTLNITRADMVHLGYSPSVRLFEAAACGVPIISDVWPGLGTFFRPGDEIFLSHSAADTLHWLRDISDTERLTVGWRARERVLAEHTAAHRALELERHLSEIGAVKSGDSAAD